MSIKPEELTGVPGMEMEELLKLIRPRGLSGEQDYLMSWLSARPAQMRSRHSVEIDPEARCETVLSALLKEPCSKIIPFKKPNG